jgi:hypothetical protein
VLWIATPSPGRSRKVHAELVEAGFRLAAVPEFQLFGSGIGNWCSVYQKVMEQGESVRFGVYGVPIFPDTPSSSKQRAGLTP